MFEIYKDNPYRNVLDKEYDKLERVESFMGQQKRTIMKKKEFLEAFIKYPGNITIACRVAGIKSRKTVYNWIKNDKHFAKAIEEGEKMRNDFFEDLLIAHAYKGNVRSIIFLLKHNHPTYMEHRRYSVVPERTKVYQNKSPEDLFGKDINSV